MAVTVSKERLNVTSLDFDQIKVNLKNFLRAQPELADYDFEGSALGTIIDVLAYNTFYNSFNANVNMNEILQTYHTSCYQSMSIQSNKMLNKIKRKDFLNCNFISFSHKQTLAK